MTLRRIILSAALMVAAASAAQADCYADYKAKRDNPLRLHYGVIELSAQACASREAAAQETARRISRDGWTLLNIMAIFGPDGLPERRANAGQFFLRY